MFYFQCLNYLFILNMDFIIIKLLKKTLSQKFMRIYILKLISFSLPHQRFYMQKYVRFEILYMVSIFKGQNMQSHYNNCPPLWSKWQHARLSRSGPKFDPRSGQVSWVRFFLTSKTNVRKLQAPKVPEYHLAVVIIIPYSPCWDDCVCVWCVLSFMFVLSRRWPRHWADHSSGGGEALHVLVWSKKYVCDPQFDSLPRQVVALKAQVA